MLLYDRLRAAITHPPLPDDIPILEASTIQQRIDLLPDHLPQATAADYGAVAPPFPAFFVEANTRSTLPSEAGQWVQRGVLFYTWDLAANGGYPPRYDHIPHYPGAAWCLIAWGYLYHLGILYHTPSCCVLQITADGALLDDTAHVQVVIDPPQTPLPATPSTVIATLMPFSLTAISALHRRCEAERVTPTRQQRRQAQRDGKPQPSAHYVIHVQPGAVRTVADIARRAPSPPGTRADFGARGHFKYYAPNKPRFGRPGDHGTFWIPPRAGKEEPITQIRRVYKIEEFR